MSEKRLISVTSSIINQPIDKVWETIGDFYDLSWCPNVVSNCVSVGEGLGNEPGAKRLVNDVFHERLRTHNNDVHMIRYVIEDGPEPISSDEIKGVHVEIKLNVLTESVTEIALNVISSVENSESVTFCTNNCINMIDDLRDAI